MWGAVIVVIAMLLVLPVGLFAGGALWSALIGNAFGADRSWHTDDPAPADG